MKRLIGILLLAVMSASAAPTTKPIALNHDLQYAAKVWRMEAKWRFADPVVVAVHGYTRDREWYCHPDPPMQEMTVQALAQVLWAAYPGQDIVLICCNHDGRDITVPNVYYAKHDVWTIPNRFNSFMPLHRDSCVGDIQEFITTTQPTTQPWSRW